MTKLTKIALASLLGMAVISTSAFADADKGQKIYSKKLKKACGMDGGKFAKHHTQDEWKEIIQNGKLKDEVTSICKDADISKIKDKHIPNLGDFVIEYASDSGNVPSC
jgi:Spy/CpxP family protein refolding chaperone